ALLEPRAVLRRQRGGVQLQQRFELCGIHGASRFPWAGAMPERGILVWLPHWVDAIVRALLDPLGRSRRPAMKLSDYVLRRVADAGVRHVFFVPGGGAMHLNDSLGREKRLEYVANLHEQASSISAEAYSRVTNALSCCMVTTGPGGTNAITGAAGAY